MAYNLESLVKILQEILHPDDHGLPWILDPAKKPVIQSLLAKASFLIDCFDNFQHETVDKVRRLESQIRDATYQAENIIKGHLADQLLLKRKGERIMISPPNLLQLTDEYEFERIVDRMVTIIDGRSAKIASSSRVVSRQEDLNPKNHVVGIGKDLLQLKDWLTSDQSKLEIMPIVGMGGIGKTTLAQSLYDDLLVVSHFDARAWVVISQSYSVREILLDLLKCVIQEPTDEMIKNNDDDDLGLCLHKALWGRRYLIVLDDIWNFEAWDKIKMFFPDDRNKSRIMVTTRELSVAAYASSHQLHHEMNFLSDVDSWNLFCVKVFAEDNVPSELEDVGKSIVTSCRGLPLSIHVVSGVLSRLEKTRDAWSQVANDVHSSMADNDKQFLKILSLSYNHLPNYLKPCFLYMSVFPEDYEIQASKLFMLWVAEGFLKPIFNKRLEDAAKIYLEQLVQRNLVLVSQPETKWNEKRYKMHDSLRHFCIKKAEEDKFYHVEKDNISDLNPKEVLYLHRLSSPSNGYISKFQVLADVTHSILITHVFNWQHIFYAPFFHENITRMKLLTVLVISVEISEEFSKIAENLVNLKCLDICVANSSLLPSLSRLCNLQTLFYRTTTCLYKGRVQELFQSTQLRHIELNGDGFLFVDCFKGESIAFQENLQTLFSVVIDLRFPKMLKAIPNMKHLGICSLGTTLYSSPIDLRCLIKLEILKCTYYNVVPPNIRVPSVLRYLIFPLFLKKLSLRNYRIPLCCMEKIGALSNLQVLALECCEFEMLTWEPNEGEFRQLQCLVFVEVDLVKWIVSEVNFPRLEHLVICGCIELEAVPAGIGDIPTLEKIEVLGQSNDSVLKSVTEIRDEQIEFGNHTLQICIDTSRKFSSHVFGG